MVIVYIDITFLERNLAISSMKILIVITSELKFSLIFIFLFLLIFFFYVEHILVV